MRTSKFRRRTLALNEDQRRAGPKSDICCNLSIFAAAEGARLAAKGRRLAPSAHYAVLEVRDSRCFNRTELFKLEVADVVKESLAAAEKERDDR